MRRYLQVFAVSWVAIVIPMTAILWLLDPFRIFHEPWIRENYYYTDLRIQASGIINTENLDSIILGTSIAANFSAREASELFGRRFVNISLDGSSMAERSVVLRYALKKRNIHDVIISLDWSALDSDSINGTPIAPYQYLYDNSRLNDLLIYASSLKRLNFMFCRNMIIHSDYACRDRIKTDLESLTEWHSSREHSDRFGGLDKWLAARNNGQIIDSLRSISNSIRTIESGEIPAVDSNALSLATKMHERVFNDHLLELATRHPRTHFHLFFPPYSRLRFAIAAQSQPQDFHAYLENLRFIVQDCARHPNISVFGFETEDFLDDIANYKDTSHYHQKFNSMMLQWMATGEHRLTPTNIETYIEQVTRRARDYPLRNIGERINSYLADNS